MFTGGDPLSSAVRAQLDLDRDFDFVADFGNVFDDDGTVSDERDSSPSVQNPVDHV